MKLAAFEKWVAQAREETRERMAAVQAQFGLGTYNRYEIDLPTATIRVFDADNVEHVRAEIQVAGSWSPTSESWLWGWENHSVPEAASSKLAPVRERGIKEKIDKLKASFAPCDESEAWSMASLASNIVGSKCVYRVPRPTNHLFLLMLSIQNVA